MDCMAAAKRGKTKVSVKDESMRIRVTDDEKEAWARAAAKDGRTVSNWLRYIANRAAGLAS
jgi:uncharacterized protein (DUF1778 family)